MPTRVLFVDDHKIIVETLASIARNYGYDSRVALSGAEAVAIAKDFLPDVLVTDYSMPGMNGLQVAAEVARHCPGCRLFLLTAYADSRTFERPARAPKLQVLSKPMPPNDLMNAISEPAPIESPRPLNILNVDDNDAHRYSITRLLSHRGFAVSEAHNGEEALSQISRGDCDAVLLDINMPDIDGFEVCRRMRQQLGLTTVAILHFTATYRSADAEDKSKLSEADDFISQPIDPDELIVRLRNAIQRRIT